MSARSWRRLAAVAPLALLCAARPSRAQDPTFDALAQGAAAPDPGLLAAALADDCADARREIDRARCRAIARRLQADLPRKTYRALVAAPDGVSLSEYDAGIGGFRLTVSGCLVCDDPIEIGSGRLPRFVTVGAPQRIRGVEELAKSAPLFEAPVKFSGVGEAKAWDEASRRHLRAEILFQPTTAEWRLRDDRGYTFKLVGLRVWNRCTGEVLTSQPRSETGRLPVTSDAGCHETPASLGGAAAGATVAGAPRLLSARAIADAIEPLRDDLDACAERFPSRGTAYLRFAIDSTGAIRRVTVEGNVAGTVLARCLLEVAGKATFPPIASDAQEFRFPIALPPR